MVSPRAGERERLEGSLLSVCMDCKEMVLQVQYSYSTLLNLLVFRYIFVFLFFSFFEEVTKEDFFWMF